MGRIAPALGDMPSSVQQAIESVAASPLAMVITNPLRADNPIEVANPAFCALTGYSEMEVAGRRQESDNCGR